MFLQCVEVSVSTKKLSFYNPKTYYEKANSPCDCRLNNLAVESISLLEIFENQKQTRFPAVPLVPALGVTQTRISCRFRTTLPGRGCFKLSPELRTGVLYR